MEPITTITVTAFLIACLYKAGETLSEKAIETVFENKQELADSFKGLFSQEIITLGLNEATTPAQVIKQLEAKPEVTAQALQKLTDNPNLLEELNEQLKKEPGGMTINAEKIGQVIKENYGTINQTLNF